MEQIYYYTGKIIWLVCGGLGTIAISLILIWLAIDTILGRTKMFLRLVDAIWNAAEYRAWKNNKDKH